MYINNSNSCWNIKKCCKRRKATRNAHCVAGDVELAAEQGDSYDGLAVGTCGAT